jgi:hypothetical protein
LSKKEIKKALEQLDLEARKREEEKKVQRLREQKLTKLIQQRDQKKAAQAALEAQESERFQRKHDYILYGAYIMTGLILGRYLSLWSRRVWFDFFENLILVIGFIGLALAKRANSKRY